MRPGLVLYPLLAMFWSASASSASPDNAALLDHELRRLHSSDVVNLRERYEGHPLLIVNTASHCGFTKQFSGLEAVHKEYADKGLKVIGFPSNDFRQESGDEEETARVCFENFGVSFDMFSPIPVKGDDAHPIFKELARQTHAPRWNFYKYLVDADGRVVAVYSSMTAPDSRRFRKALDELVAQKP